MGEGKYFHLGKDFFPPKEDPDFAQTLQKREFRPDNIGGSNKSIDDLPTEKIREPITFAGAPRTVEPISPSERLIHAYKNELNKIIPLAGRTFPAFQENYDHSDQYTKIRQDRQTVRTRLENLQGELTEVLTLDTTLSDESKATLNLLAAQTRNLYELSLILSANAHGLNTLTTDAQITRWLQKQTEESPAELWPKLNQPTGPLKRFVDINRETEIVYPTKRETSTVQLDSKPRLITLLKTGKPDTVVGIYIDGKTAAISAELELVNVNQSSTESAPLTATGSAEATATPLSSVELPSKTPNPLLTAADKEQFGRDYEGHAIEEIHTALNKIIPRIEALYSDIQTGHMDAQKAYSKLTTLKTGFNKLQTYIDHNIPTRSSEVQGLVEGLQHVNELIGFSFEKAHRAASNDAVQTLVRDIIDYANKKLNTVIEFRPVQSGMETPPETLVTHFYTGVGTRQLDFYLDKTTGKIILADKTINLATPAGQAELEATNINFIPALRDTLDETLSNTELKTSQPIQQWQEKLRNLRNQLIYEYDRRPISENLSKSQSQQLRTMNCKVDTSSLPFPVEDEAVIQVMVGGPEKVQLVGRNDIGRQICGN